MAKRDISASIDLVAAVSLAPVSPEPVSTDAEAYANAENTPVEGDAGAKWGEGSDEQKAVINGSNLISFVTGLGAVEKSDVIDSTQFASRAADAKFSRT